MTVALFARGACAALAALAVAGSGARAPGSEGAHRLVAPSWAGRASAATAELTVRRRHARRVNVTVSPAAATVAAGGSRTFNCAVTGAADKACTWVVREGDAGGTVTGAGVYTAPRTAGTFHVVARSHADATKRAVASVTVTAAQPPPTVAVTIAPKTATLTAGSSQAFTCSVTGSTDSACTWSVQEGAPGGVVTSAGVYTAPKTAGTYHVVATSHADATRSDAATVTVSAPLRQVVAISLAPTSAAVDACGTYRFAATVTGSSNPAVTWSVSEGSAGGSVSSSGVYTAPATGGTYHVVATSDADPTRSQTATVTVTERIVSVEVTPGSTTVTAGGTIQFTATVTTTCGSFTQTAGAGAD